MPYQVLDGTPAYQIATFVDEVLERRATTIQAMRPALVGLLGSVFAAVSSLKEQAPTLDLGRVRIRRTEWTQTGELVLQLDCPPQGAPEPPLDRYHVDALVDDLLAEMHLLHPFRAEATQFLTALVDQFGVLKKHALALSLEAVTFERPRVKAGCDLIVDVRHAGQPFSPREARWS